MSSDQIHKIEKRLEEIERERQNLAGELSALRANRYAADALLPLLGIPASTVIPTTSEEKIEKLGPLAKEALPILKRLASDEDFRNQKANELQSLQTFL